MTINIKIALVFENLAFKLGYEPKNSAPTRSSQVADNKFFI